MPILIGSAAMARRDPDGAAARAIPASADLVTVRRVIPLPSVMRFLPFGSHSLDLL
jgi:hypothetical protein